MKKKINYLLKIFDLKPKYYGITYLLVEEYW